MTVGNARRWLVMSSLAVATGTFVFFVAAPVLGFPLRYSQAMGILQIIFPVFLGYVGAATQFLFQKPKTDTPVQGDYFPLLVKGPIVIFCVLVITAIAAFGYSNRADATLGSGISADMLAGTITAALGLLTVSTNVIVSYLFSADTQAKPRVSSRTT